MADYGRSWGCIERGAFPDVCVSPKRKLIKLKEDFKQRDGGKARVKKALGVRITSSNFTSPSGLGLPQPCNKRGVPCRRKNTGDVYGFALQPALYFCLGIHSDKII